MSTVRIEPLSLHDRIRGCLLGGAAGDALGAPVEFLGLAEIRGQFGPAGIRAYAPAYGRAGAITDDTQMTLFTAEGLIRAWVRLRTKGITIIEGVVFHAYLRWLLTQRERPKGIADQVGRDGWLFGLRALHHRRAPGMTCLRSLRAAESAEGPLIARNDSKGCGGVMRVAPVGLLGRHFRDSRLFELGADTARLTHGHPSGYLSAGYLAVMVAALARGEDWPEALAAADRQIAGVENAGEVTGAVASARALAANGRPTPEALQTLGGGWVAEEALAIAICCALVARDFDDGIILAANHSGDSDSTAAITGNLLGTRLGVAAIAPAWLQELELAVEITELADDLHAVATDVLDPDAAWSRYPGW